MPEEGDDTSAPQQTIALAMLAGSLVGGAWLGSVHPVAGVCLAAAGLVCTVIYQWRTLT